PVLSRRLVSRWMNKDARPLRDAVQAWVEERWADLSLSAGSFVEKLQAEVVERLGGAPELAVKAARSLSGVDAWGGRNSRQWTPEELAPALLRLEELVGKPSEGAQSAERRPQSEEGTAEGQLVLLLREAAGRLVAEWGQKLAELP